MIADVFEILEKYNYPNVSGLNYVNEFTFLVAIILSAQAKDEFINTQTPLFFAKASTPEQMVELGVDGICEYIKRIGLWRNKALNIYKLAQQVCELKAMSEISLQNWYDDLANKYDLENGDDFLLHEKNSEREIKCIDGSKPKISYDDSSKIISNEGIPKFRLGLVQLAGVGRKSANVFLNCIYNAHVFPVDTHVIRLTHRLGIAEGTPVEIEKTMQEIVPDKYSAHASNWLVWHGRRVCFAKKPDCVDCLLKNYCNFFKK